MADALKRFGEEVRKRREQLNLTQEELAEKATSHRNYIGGIERGERNPTLLKLCDLAKALECTPADLVNPLHE